MGNAKELKKSNNKTNAKPHDNKFKTKGPIQKARGGAKIASGTRPPYKRPHGKPGFTKSKEDIKNERAQKFQERKAAREQKQKELEEQREKAKKEKEEKIRQYKKKRLEKTKILCKRTQRGQPLMKDRMQLLLKQIQEMKKNG